MAMTLSRRNFLARTGVLAAAAAAAQGGLRLPAARAQSPGDLLDALNPALQQLAFDAIAGMGAFLIPSTDDYSQVQGLTDDRPGAIAAENPAFMLDALDKKFLPIPDTAARALAQGFATSVSDIPIPPELLDGILDGSDSLDDLLLQLLENDDTVPTSLVIAMYLNFAASMTDPASIAGPFLAPFANLSWADKGAALAMIEEDHADLALALDSQLSEPLHSSVSGLLKFVPGALLEFVGFGTYSEYHTLDHAADPMRLQARPVGWEISKFQEGMLESGQGWDEFIGYHKGVQDVEGSWQRGEGVLDRA